MLLEHRSELSLHLISVLWNRHHARSRKWPLPLLLFDVLFEDFRNLVCALLWVSLLTAFVVDISHAEPCCVAFGPFEVTAYCQPCILQGIAFEPKMERRSTLKLKQLTP